MGIESSKIMLVSVIIPAYNSEKTIVRTLDSVFSQNYASLEVIVVNDGSTDNTEQVVKSYSDKIIYIAQKNAGVSVARNKGFELSSGEFIQYLDADDLLAEDKISQQVKAILDSRADVAYGDWKKFNELNGYQEFETVKKELKGRPEIELITDFWIPLAALLYTRSIANKIGGWNLDLPIIQDARYALDAAIQGAKFVYTPGIMGLYRVNDSGSLSTLSRMSFMSDCYLNAKQIDAIWRKDYDTDREKKNAVIGVLRFCISEFSKLDKVKFNQAIDLILSIDKNYKPEGSFGMKVMSSLLGYRTAEKIAQFKRKLG